MDKSQVDLLPGNQPNLLTVTPSAVIEIKRLGENKPQGAFRIRCDILALKTDIYFEWDDQFASEDYILNIADVEIVMDATSIAYILDEYTLDFDGIRFMLYKNLDGPVRHQRK